MPKKRVHNYVFDTKNLLGQGSFGSVYEAKLDAPNQRPQRVALKALDKKRIDQDRHHKESFMSQIKTLKKVVSPNIVGFKEVLETDHHYYIVQQYCDGGDLQGLLRKQGPLSQNRAIQYMIEILTGFFDIMRCGIVHRDFKPHNVLINKKKLKIGDFGLARSAGELMSTQVGTPVYESPQILNGEVYSSKCDIWALGLVFYQMLYNELPWKHANVSKKQYYKQIMQTKLTFPQQPIVSQQVKQFITNCLIRTQIGRTDWPQVFRCQIFEDKLPNYEILDQIFSYTVTQITNNIEENCYDLKKMFIKFNSKNNSDQLMTRKDLKQMIKKLAPNVKSYHMDFVLSKFDKNSDGLIDFEEFRKTLRTGQMIKSALSVDELKNVIFRLAQGSKEEFMEKCRKLWITLSKRISDKFLQKKQRQNDDMLPFTLLQKHRLKNSKKIAFNQQLFTAFLRDIDPCLSQNQCYFLFREFDADGDDQISPDEYFRKLNELIVPDDQQQNAQKNA